MVLFNLDPQMVAVTIFLAVFIAIATEKIQRTIAALLGSAALWAFGIIDVEDLFHFIDFEVLALLFGMMVIVAGLRHAKFFRWLGIYLANISGCDPKRMLILFTLMTALLSAFLDNVTTMLFMITVTLEIVEVLRIPALPFILSEIFAANIGGTATLIGDPPNIMIASALDLTFIDFLIYVAPIVIVCLLSMTYLWYRKVKVAISVPREFTVMPIKPSEVVTDAGLFYISFGVFSIVISLFFLHDMLKLEPAVIALVGSIVLLGISGNKIPHVFKDIEWETLIFFASIFVVVGGLEKVGVMDIITKIVLNAIGTNEVLSMTVIMWVSAVGSAFIDNIPLTATFIPMIEKIAASIGIDVKLLAWSLSLGTGFGGNGSPIGSSATIVAIGIVSAKGHPISFKEFVKNGILILAITVGLANALLLLGYLLLM
jgi:Na+/H+ antiporter NhaD/arsenite permease-like protein